MGDRLSVSVHVEEWTTKIPFHITGYSFSAFKMIVVQLSNGTCQAWGEGLPVFYLGDTIERACAQIEAVTPQLRQEVDRDELIHLLPPGAARNALDCALWDLEAKQSHKTIWELTGIIPKPLTTAFTIGIESTPEMMAQRAREASMYPILKVKLNADRPLERMMAIRTARPDARLIVDANQAWTFEQLVYVAPALAELDVRFIEQPLPRGSDTQLGTYKSPVPLCADESCQHRGELQSALRSYQIINIKLDKAGGLTEALRLAKEARGKGLQVLVGNMGGTSLSMAPAYVLGQLCHYADLDGHLLLRHDRPSGLACVEGVIDPPHPQLWG